MIHKIFFLNKKSPNMLLGLLVKSINFYMTVNFLVVVNAPLEILIK